MLKSLILSAAVVFASTSLEDCASKCISPPECSEFTTCGECAANRCAWVNGQCADTCTDIDAEVDDLCLMDESTCPEADPAEFDKPSETDQYRAAEEFMGELMEEVEAEDEDECAARCTFSAFDPREEIVKCGAFKYDSGMCMLISEGEETFTDVMKYTTVLADFTVRVSSIAYPCRNFHLRPVCYQGAATYPNICEAHQLGFYNDIVFGRCLRRTADPIIVEDPIILDPIYPAPVVPIVPVVYPRRVIRPLIRVRRPLYRVPIIRSIGPVWLDAVESELETCLKQCLGDDCEKDDSAGSLPFQISTVGAGARKCLSQSESGVALDKCEDESSQHFFLTRLQMALKSSKGNVYGFNLAGMVEGESMCVSSKKNKLTWGDCAEEDAMFALVPMGTGKVHQIQTWSGKLCLTKTANKLSFKKCAKKKKTQQWLVNPLKNSVV